MCDVYGSCAVGFLGLFRVFYGLLGFFRFLGFF